ncbi:HEAT repeat domain-containing protein [Pontiella sulfatireligans]|uniref:HEAT repeat domain-containing protein n=1 Tax=Pontiella sulfatireligans TaxID=2750658 RepID=A0A6C2UTJ1_9BACT|nr:HEAT repeat domain-containing protein [Pontiella sulfatireligans]VGO23283.1 hypothetical protein SCARR_05390 [Pontiella sulfatireligans]
MKFLNAPMPDDSKLGSRSFNSIRNDALEILLRQKKMHEGMGELLISVYNDPSHDDMWRNYCVQFMEPFYEKQFEELSLKSEVASGGMLSSASSGNGDVAPPELQAIQDALWDALGERDNSNAGTALLALDKLSRNHAEFSKDDINAAMFNLAQDNDATLANRVTALRLCGERNNIQALETVRDLSRNGDTTMLRCAAIATLGEIGTEEDLVLLKAFAASRDKRIRRIAESALKKQDPE